MQQTRWEMEQAPGGRAWPRAPSCPRLALPLPQHSAALCAEMSSPRHHKIREVSISCPLTAVALKCSESKVSRNQGPARGATLSHLVQIVQDVTAIMKSTESSYKVSKKSIFIKPKQVRKPSAHPGPRQAADHHRPCTQFTTERQGETASQGSDLLLAKTRQCYFS